MNEKDILNQAITFFGNELGATVWLKKYALKTREKQLVETHPIQTLKRMLDQIYRMEDKYNDNLFDRKYLQEMLFNMDIVLGGSNLFGIGNDYHFTSLGNCFVVGNAVDSYGGICKIDEEQAQLMKRRGGVGHDLSHIRPEGSLVNNAANTSTGIVPFMERYSNTTREVAQDGRRGALMLTLDIRHPDAEKFILSKNDLTKITGANISLKITDDFMNAVIEDESFVQRFPIDSPEDSCSTYKVIKARDLWNKIITQAHKSAEPGVIFIDRVIEESPADCYTDEGFGTVSTNPCGELPLCPYDSCRLLAINLFNMVEAPFTENALINWKKLINTAHIAQVIMDDIVSLEEEKILAILTKLRDSSEVTKEVEIELWEKIYKKLLEGRRTGIGVMGLGDMFAALNLKYASNEAILLAEEVQQEITGVCYSASVDMAKTRGAFKIWNLNKELHHPFLNRIFNHLWDLGNTDIYEDYKIHGRRNIANLTIAPTGTISLMAGVTSGIEPVFSIYHERRVKVLNPQDADYKDILGDHWKTYFVIHPKFELWYTLTHSNDKPLSKYTKEELDELIKKSPYYLSSSHEIDPLQKVKLQGKMQQWIDHSISVTHNLPTNVTIEEVNNIYLYAYKNRCKGVTIYRDGSREGVLNITSHKINNDGITYYDAPKRPKVLPAEIHLIRIKDEYYVVVVGLLNGKPYELFCRKLQEPLPALKNTKGVIIKIKKKRFDYNSDELEIPNLQESVELLHSVITVFISTSLRHGVKLQFIIHAIDKFELDVSSLISAIQRVLKKYIPNGTESHENCSECGHKLVYEGGCSICPNCGNSKCG